MGREIAHQQIVEVHPPALAHAGAKGQRRSITKREYGERRSPSLTGLRASFPTNMGKWWEAVAICAIFRAMAKQKPPDSKGRLSGFPYSILWEEFAEIWNELGASSDTVGRAETLLTKLSSKERRELKYPTHAKITDLVNSFGDELGVADTVALSGRLYAIAAAYTLPKLQRATGQGVAETRRRLNRISKTAGDLSEMLGEIDLQLEVVLGSIRAGVVDQTSVSAFHLKQLKSELSDLAASAKACASELPRMARGKSVNVLQARLMEAASRAIGDASTVEVEVKQADSAGRNPRPGSLTADLLFNYLTLVDPGMTAIVNERLFARFGRSWASVTHREIQEDRNPKKWRRRTGRIDLIRDMHSK